MTGGTGVGWKHRAMWRRLPPEGCLSSSASYQRSQTRRRPAWDHDHNHDHDDAVLRRDVGAVPYIAHHSFHRGHSPQVIGHHSCATIHHHGCWTRAPCVLLPLCCSEPHHGRSSLGWLRMLPSRPALPSQPYAPGCVHLPHIQVARLISSHDETLPHGNGVGPLHSLDKTAFGFDHN